MSILGIRDVRFVWRLNVGSRAINANCAITIRIAHLLPVIVASDHCATVAARSIDYGTLGWPSHVQRSVHHGICSSVPTGYLSGRPLGNGFTPGVKQETRQVDE